MTQYQNQTAAATAALGYDLCTGQIYQISPKNRVLRKVGITGSATIGDTAIDVYIDQVKVGTFYNTKLLVGNNDDLINVGDLYVPAGALVHAIVTDAAATNPVFFMIVLDDLPW